MAVIFLSIGLEKKEFEARRIGQNENENCTSEKSI
jgi:hypothetical protein